MLLENLKSKKIQNVCVEIWLHPLHPEPPNPQRGNKRCSVGRKKSGYPNDNFFVFPNSFLSVLEKLKQVQFDKHSIFGIPTFDNFGFIFRIVGWFDLLLRR